MKKLIPILIAIPVFLFALMLMRPETTVPVVVAAADLPEGQMLSASDVQVRQFSQGEAPQGAFSDPQQLAGQTLRVFRAAGDVIYAANLGGEAITLAADERAIAIHVTDAAGLAGLLRPGDTVGVTAVLDTGSGSFAKTVANGLRVLYLSPEFRASQQQSTTSQQTQSSSAASGGFSTTTTSGSTQRREIQGTVVLAVPVDAVSIGYDFSLVGVASESRLVSLTDLLPALDLVGSVELSLFLEPDSPQGFVTSGLFLPNLVITPGPSPTPTETPLPGTIVITVTPTPASQP